MLGIDAEEIVVNADAACGWTGGGWGTGSGISVVRHAVRNVRDRSDLELYTGVPPMTADPMTRAGKIRYAAAAWLLGLPIPIILIALLWGGCTSR